MVSDCKIGRRCNHRACRRISGTLLKKLPDPYRAEMAATMEARSEEHTSELQSLMRISYAVFCLKKKKQKKNKQKKKIRKQNIDAARHKKMKKYHNRSEETKSNTTNNQTIK